ncbi:peptidoglycan-binding protein [Streptomyces sp. NPDC101118]|uniref:peptidoglycan-binding protein n=1 Tax=Streptomyces sp. NPDC101118 TaxID=3366109 RepID=UPI0038128186
MQRGAAVKKWLVAGLVVLAAAGGGGYVLVAQPGGDAGGEERRTDGLPPDTAPVTRGDLGNGLQVDGTLGYAKERKLNAAAQGVLTWVAGEGSAVPRDGRLYEVDGRPVRLMYGSVPMYRALKAGDEGEDVKQLKANLRALGFGTGLDPDDGTFTQGTVTAVKRWQKSHGLKQTGQVGPGDVAFATGPQRVQAADAATGDQAAPGKPVLTLTGTERVVRFKLDVGRAASARTGDEVTVSLPGGGTATGRIGSVGRAAADEGQGQGSGGAGDGAAKVEVTVLLDRPGEVRAPDRTPVSVGLTGETVKGVLSVPVNALLALAGGGFGVQVVEDGPDGRPRVREVRVELGMFGQGRVEVKGGALKEGMKVGVPKI